MNNFVRKVLEDGGKIKSLIIPSEFTNGTGLMNPSILYDNGIIRVILRHVNYTFYHSERKLFQHPWGPLTYVHPENDIHLRTVNFYLELDDNLDVIRYNKIDTSKFDNYEPMWDFVGLEDARIFKWDGKVYVSGVRRDLDTIGTGRMELCEINISNNNVKEISRLRIPPPKDKDSYCEKNWMPILDIPYHYVKWTNPTEIVKIDCKNKKSETVILKKSQLNFPRDIRGGSQVIKINNNYIACIHEVDLFTSEVGRKDAKYYHRFIVWDEDWNIVNFSNDFNFMGGDVEFCVGMTKKDDDILMTFGFQDNAAYVIKSPIETIMKFIDSK